VCKVNARAGSWREDGVQVALAEQMLTKPRDPVTCSTLQTELTLVAGLLGKEHHDMSSGAC
jgi:hypothetical protein